ncbi:MAG: hypothetical protein WAK55_13315 [Xanthobacteraceae bacterium]
MAYNLNSPQQWLLERAQRWNSVELYKALSDLARRVDGGSIQDLFQSEMAADGYFAEERKPKAAASDAEFWGSHRWHT